MSDGHAAGEFAMRPITRLLLLATALQLGCAASHARMTPPGPAAPATPATPTDPASELTPDDGPAAGDRLANAVTAAQTPPASPPPPAPPQAVDVAALPTTRLAGAGAELTQRLQAWLTGTEDAALVGVSRPQRVPARAPSGVLAGAVRHGILADAEAGFALERRLCEPAAGETVAQRQAACLLDALAYVRLTGVEGAELGPRSQRPAPHRKGRSAAELRAAEDARVERMDAHLRAVALALAAGGGDAETLDGWLDQAGPMRYPPYRAMLDGLQRYRGVSATGWAKLPEGLPIAPAKAYRDKAAEKAWRAALDDSHRAALAARLAAEPAVATVEDAAPDAPVAAPDQAALEAEIAAFQRRHGLRPTGLVDAATRRALDVSVAERVGQLRLALQRMRDAEVGADARYGVANVPAFRVDFYRDGALWRRHRTQVGKATRKTRTPLLRAALRYIVVNPEWVVPTSIQREYRKKVSKDPDYLAKHGFRMEPGGKMVMRAGDDNLLGRVKFLFPNEHLVYLHDTPNRWAFGLPTRLQSHGCVRVQDAEALARAMLDADEADDRRWDERRWKKLRAEANDKWMRLDQPWQMLLVYWTADAVQTAADAPTELRFYPDAYRYDARDRAQTRQRFAALLAAR
ncbi:MAG: hypothetical protein RIT45_4220 [Pseudomonadota bacterium]